MTNWLDILKETELRVGFTDVLRTVGVREVLSPEAGCRTFYPVSANSSAVLVSGC